MITTESASALGTIEGENFATRQVMAIKAAATLATGEMRDLMISAVSANWQAKQLEDVGKRRLELAERGADLAVMTAYEAAWIIAFSATLRAASAELLPEPPAPPAKRKGRADAARAH